MLALKIKLTVHERKPLCIAHRECQSLDWKEQTILLEDWKLWMKRTEMHILMRNVNNKAIHFEMFAV